MANITNAFQNYFIPNNAERMQNAMRKAADSGCCCARVHALTALFYNILNMPAYIILAPIDLIGRIAHLEFKNACLLFLQNIGDALKSLLLIVLLIASLAVHCLLKKIKPANPEVQDKAIEEPTKKEKTEPEKPISRDPPKAAEPTSDIKDSLAKLQKTIDQLTHEHEDELKERQELETQLETEKAQKEEIAKRLSELEAALQSAQASPNGDPSKEAELQSLREQLAALSKKEPATPKSRTPSQSLEKREGQLVKQKMDLEKQLEELNLKFAQMEKQIKDKNFLIFNTGRKLTEVQKDLEIAKASLAEYKDCLDQWQVSHKKLEVKIKELLNQEAALIKKIESGKWEISDKFRECQKKLTNVRRVHAQFLQDLKIKENSVEAQEKIKALENAIVQLKLAQREEVNGIQKEHTNLYQRLVKKHQEMISKLRKEITELTKKLQILVEPKISELNGQGQELFAIQEQTIATLRQERDLYTNRVDMLRTEIKALKKAQPAKIASN